MRSLEPHPELVLPDGPGPWWWTCSAPERPHDVWAMYSGDCASCTIALEALRHRDPSVPMDQRDPETGDWLRNVTVGDLR